MREYTPSRTAFRVALRRAAHQLIDHPKVFDDPLAVSILGPDAATELASEVALNEHPFSRALRAFLAVRSRYAEDQLAMAVQRGVRQYVVLGAGLDTFAFRNRFAEEGLRVFEVDHPSTQEWKRERLRAAGIPVPPNAFFVAVDFERQSLAEALPAAGFRTDAAGFCSWLGVVPYLTESAFAATIAYIAAMPPESGVAFDYAADRSTLSPEGQAALDVLAARVARAGEPFQLFFKPGELTDRLRRAGFREIEDLGGAEINARYSLDNGSGLRIRSGRLVSARV